MTIADDASLRHLSVTSPPKPSRSIKNGVAIVAFHDLPAARIKIGARYHYCSSSRHAIDAIPTRGWHAFVAIDIVRLTAFNRSIISGLAGTSPLVTIFSLVIFYFDDAWRMN